MSSMVYLEEATHFSAVGTFAPMAYEERNDVPIQIDAICTNEKKTNKQTKNKCIKNKKHYERLFWSEIG